MSVSVQTFDQIYKYFLDQKLSGKNTTFQYSRKNKICKQCPLRLKCMTNILKKCFIRQQVDLNLSRGTRLFKNLTKQPIFKGTIVHGRV